jgi:hypothetical protein
MGASSVAGVLGSTNGSAMPPELSSPTSRCLTILYEQQQQLQSMLLHSKLHHVYVVVAMHLLLESSQVCHMRCGYHASALHLHCGRKHWWSFVEGQTVMGHKALLAERRNVSYVCTWHQLRLLRESLAAYVKMTHLTGDNMRQRSRVLHTHADACTRTCA